VGILEDRMKRPWPWWRVAALVVFSLAGTAICLYNGVAHRYGDEANIFLALIFAGLAVGVLRYASKQRQQN